tara:strand:- start:2083 stop:4170 length:2088 start_codon:yes stop_codon:yes gene_type:complete
LSKPLSLPSPFDYDLYMPLTIVNGQEYHPPRKTAELLATLLANGTPEDIANAEKIVPGLLECQDTDPDSPHYGAFPSGKETPVEALNIVEFCLFALIPMIMDHEALLSPETAQKLRESIRLALGNVRRIDVHHKYTNVAIKDITNTCMGGELLGDPEIAQRGYDKLKSWMAFTDRSGGNYEYNSIPYTPLAIHVLSTLTRRVKDADTRIRASVALSRMALGAYLHAHTPTHRWAGPHGRAYHFAVIGRGNHGHTKEKETESLRDWLDTGRVPPWLDGLLDNPTWPDQVVETTGRDEGIYTSVFKDANYSFGVASRNMFNQDIVYIAWQSNVYTVHYRMPGEELAGVLYTRYVLDDNWLGDFSPGADRGSSGMIPDMGHFQGVQDENRAIALYIPRNLNGIERHHSAKAVIALPHWNPDTDKIWIDDFEVTTLPSLHDHNATVVLETGDIMIAIRPFTLTSLCMAPWPHGGKEQLRIADKDGTMTIELYNYRNAAKTFWELSWPGAFFQGWPQCGFYSEIANRNDYEDGAAFAAVVSSGQFRDESSPPATYSGSDTETRPWLVDYSRDGRTLGLKVDLFDWFRAPERYTHAGKVPMPMLDSRYAHQSRSGRIQISDVTLITKKDAAAWLYVSPDGQTIAAAYHGPTPSHLELVHRNFRVSLKSLECGTVVWAGGQVSVDAIGLTSEPAIAGSSLKP